MHGQFSRRRRDNESVNMVSYGLFLSWWLIVGCAGNGIGTGFAPEASGVRSEAVELATVEILKRPFVGVVISGSWDRTGENAELHEANFNGFAYGPFLFFSGVHVLFLLVVKCRGQLHP